jgi:hypothetical protein
MSDLQKNDDFLLFTIGFMLGGLIMTVITGILCIIILL